MQKKKREMSARGGVKANNEAAPPTDRHEA